MNLIFSFLQAVNEMFGVFWCPKNKKVIPFLSSCILQVAALWHYVSSFSQLCHTAFCVLHVIKMQNPLASGNVISQGDWCSSDRQEMITFLWSSCKLWICSLLH